MFETLTPTEEKAFKRCNTPAKIQDYLNRLKNNWEPAGDTCRSPRVVMQEGSAHCIEGAILAAAMLLYHGEKPLLLDLRAKRKDLDHVVALFKRDNHWGAISKTNHAVLRYREPVYKTIRELALSYFHEYFTNDGTKNLVSYSKPLNLFVFGDNWITTEEELWGIPDTLEEQPHYLLYPKGLDKHFRLADAIERTAGTITEWQR